LVSFPHTLKENPLLQPLPLRTSVGKLRIIMVRAAGIEPALQAWEAHVLPIYYARPMEVFHTDRLEINHQDEFAKF
jgi:hypothetical protein